MMNNNKTIEVVTRPYGVPAYQCPCSQTATYVKPVTPKCRLYRNGIRSNGHPSTDVTDNSIHAMQHRPSKQLRPLCKWDGPTVTNFPGQAQAL